MLFFSVLRAEDVWGMPVKGLNMIIVVGNRECKRVRVLSRAHGMQAFCFHLLLNNAGMLENQVYTGLIWYGLAVKVTILVDLGIWVL